MSNYPVVTFHQFIPNVVGKTMYSDQFTVPVHGKLTRWRLKMYPNGRKTVDQGYVTLFLKDSGREQPANLKAQVKFSVVDAMGNKINTKTIDKEYKVLNHAFGYSKFIKHQSLMAPERMLLPDDKLTLLCTITIAGKNIISSGFQKPATCQPEADIKTLSEVSCIIRKECIIILLISFNFC